jgi:hypothetical protein
VSPVAKIRYATVAWMERNALGTAPDAALPKGMRALNSADIVATLPSNGLRRRLSWVVGRARKRTIASPVLMATLRGGLLLVAAGLVLTLLARDKGLGLVITVAGVTLLAYGVVKTRVLGTQSDGKEPRPTRPAHVGRAGGAGT